MLKVASFFSGIGGFDIGFEHTNMQVVFQCEINKFGQAILQKHWSGIKLAEDIANISSHDIPTAEIWCAGFPCQDLSLANQGKRQGLEGKRSGLFHNFADLIEELENNERPKWIILENVPGLLNSHNGTDFKIVLERLNHLGYGVAWRVFDAKYFGSPQRRRRVFLVGSLGSLDCLNVLFDNINLETVSRQSLGIKDLKSQFYPVSNSSLYVLQHATIGRKPEAGPQAKGYRNDGEAYTLDSRGSADVVIRSSQPFNIDIDNNVQSDSNRYRAVGNAVSTHVVKWIARRLRKAQLCRWLQVNIDMGKIAQNIVGKIKNASWENLKETSVEKWSNAGLMHNGEYAMGNIFEHEYSSEPKIVELATIIENTVPLKYFLPSEQLLSILVRAEAKGRELPKDLKDAVEMQMLMLKENRNIDNWIKSKRYMKGERIQIEEIPPRLLSRLKVRRLTPTEYEALQGFPSNWTLL